MSLDGTDWISILPLLFIGCILGGKLFNLFMCHVPQLENGTNDTYLADLQRWVCKVGIDQMTF